MDRIVPTLLQFDRFVLDLRRGCVRAGDQDIELRPKRQPQPYGARVMERSRSQHGRLAAFQRTAPAFDVGRQEGIS